MNGHPVQANFYLSYQLTCLTYLLEITEKHGLELAMTVIVSIV